MDRCTRSCPNWAVAPIFTRTIFIERSDFDEDPPPKKWCLKPGAR